MRLRARQIQKTNWGQAGVRANPNSVRRSEVARFVRSRADQNLRACHGGYSAVAPQTESWRSPAAPTRFSNPLSLRKKLISTAHRRRRTMRRAPRSHNGSGALDTRPPARSPVALRRHRHNESLLSISNQLPEPLRMAAYACVVGGWAWGGWACVT